MAFGNPNRTFKAITAKTHVRERNRLDKEFNDAALCNTTHTDFVDTR